MRLGTFLSFVLFLFSNICLESLTASVRKDPVTREWVLEGGALGKERKKERKKFKTGLIMKQF